MLIKTEQATKKRQSFDDKVFYLSGLFRIVTVWGLGAGLAVSTVFWLAVAKHFGAGTSLCIAVASIVATTTTLWCIPYLSFVKQARLAVDNEVTKIIAGISVVMMVIFAIAFALALTTIIWFPFVLPSIIQEMRNGRSFREAEHNVVHAFLPSFRAKAA